MDTNSAKLLKQLKQYDKAMEKYQRSKKAALARQLRKLGDLDKKREKLLTQAGFDVPALRKEAQESAKILDEAQQAALALEVPSTFPGEFIAFPPDPNVFSVKPPAVDSLLQLGIDLPRGTEYGFKLAAGQIHFKMRDEGEGLGLFGEVASTTNMTLVFYFLPTRAGPVQVDAFVDFYGTYAVWAMNDFWNSPDALFRLSVTSRLFQDHWVLGPTLRVVDKYVSDSAIESGWVDPRLWKLSYTANISTGTPILIFVETKWQSSAVGPSAIEVNFGAPNHWVRVPAIFFSYL